MRRSPRPRITHALVMIMHSYLFNGGYIFYERLIKEHENWHTLKYIRDRKKHIPFHIHKYGYGSVKSVMHFSQECDDWSECQFEDWWYQIINFMVLCHRNEPVGHNFSLVGYLPDYPVCKSNENYSFMDELARL